MTFGGAMAINLARWDQGHGLLAASLACSANAGEAPVPYTFCVLALNALVANRPDEARSFSERAVAVARESGTRYEIAESLAHQALMIALTTNDPRGVALSDEALELSRQSGSAFLHSLTLEVAGIARYRSDPAAAIVLLEDSMRERLHTGITQQALFFKALAHLSLNQNQDAARDLDETLARMHELGEDYYQTMVLAGIAGLLARVDAAVPAIRILASLARLRDEARFIGAPRDIKAQDRLREHLEQGTDPHTFQSAWTAGNSLTLDETVALAHNELAHVRPDR